MEYPKNEETNQEANRGKESNEAILCGPHAQDGRTLDFPERCARGGKRTLSEKVPVTVRAIAEPTSDIRTFGLTE